MLWSTLRNRLGKTPDKIGAKQHVNALIRNPKTGLTETVFLTLKYDNFRNPYFVVDTDPHENPRRPVKTHRD